MMYRLCERYLVGAITPQEFVTQAAHHQRLIVSVLAIEQVTGAVQLRTIVVSTISQASAGENIGVIQKVLDSARGDLGNVEGDLEKAKVALAEASNIPMFLCAAASTIRCSICLRGSQQFGGDGESPPKSFKLTCSFRHVLTAHCTTDAANCPRAEAHPLKIPEYQSRRHGPGRAESRRGRLRWLATTARLESV